MRNQIISVFYILVILSSCRAQELNVYNEIQNLVEDNCDELYLSLGIDESECGVVLSARIIPITITPFHEIIDSLMLIPNNNKDSSFSNANLFDLRNYEESYELKSTTRREAHANRKVIYVRLYCSSEINGLITCEAVQIDQGNVNNELFFGESLLYLFKASKNNKVILIESTMIQNN